MLSPEVQDFASRSILCWLATVGKNGQPNVSPKEIFAVIDAEHLVIANIASPASAQNIEANPLVCVSFVDVFVQKGFKVSGEARNVRKQDTTFCAGSLPWRKRRGLGSFLAACLLFEPRPSSPSLRRVTGCTPQRRQNSPRWRQPCVHTAYNRSEGVAKRVFEQPATGMAAGPQLKLQGSSKSWVPNSFASTGPKFAESWNAGKPRRSIVQSPRSVRTDSQRSRL